MTAAARPAFVALKGATDKSAVAPAHYTKEILVALVTIKLCKENLEKVLTRKLGGYIIRIRQENLAILFGGFLYGQKRNFSKK